MNRLGVHLEGGVIARVTSSDSSLVDREVVIENDGVPLRLVRVSEDFEGAITKHLHGARLKSQAHLIGTACEVASEALLEISQQPGATPDELVRKIQAAMDALSRACARAAGV